MDTKSGYPFWVLKNGLLPDYPQLERDVRCDVVVVGGGITGALIADELSRHGHETIVVEQRDIGWGSTAASTALLQYEIDVHMIDLAKRYDEATAALAYTTCAEAVEVLIALGRGLRDVGLQRCDSVYLASRPRDLAVLAAEHALRARHGIASRMLDADAVRERYAITAPGALRARPAGVIDPYRFTCRLLARAHRRGVQIFDRTTIARLRKTARGVTLRTERGHEIRAGHAVIAAGYASQAWLRERVARNRSTYAFISDPVAPAALAHLARTLFWESSRPYHYARLTTDHRVLVGGEDDRLDRPAVRDARVHAKANKLHRYATTLFELELTQAFAWAGTFAETPDGLPYFGPHRQHGDRVLFAMAYGGNGITYSALGAGLLRAYIERAPHRLRALYAFER